MAKLQLVGLIVAFILLGSLAYYTFTLSSELNQKNTGLQQEVTLLQGSITKLEGNITQLQTSLIQSRAQEDYMSQQAAYFQTVLQEQGSQQSMNAQQLSAAQAMLQNEEVALTTLSTQIATIQSGNSDLIAKIGLEIQNISSQIRLLQTGFQTIVPAVFLRTQGTALASYVEGPEDYMYLRLTEVGSGSLVESALGTSPFNATIAGNSVAWKTVANTVASDSNHWFWPMVLENAPGGTNAIEFEDAAGTQEAAVVSNGIRTVQIIGWDPTVVHTFMIVIVSPGRQVNFYIDGNKVATITTGIPAVGFLLEAAEVKGVGTTASGVACVDAYGGLFGSQ
jgi:hypothetical protein